MISYDETDYEELSLIGIRLEIDRATPEFFFLAFTGHSAMLPLMQDDRILIFTNRRHVQRVIAMAECEDLARSARRNETWFGLGRGMAGIDELDPLIAGFDGDSRGSRHSCRPG